MRMRPINRRTLVKAAAVSPLVAAPIARLATPDVGRPGIKKAVKLGMVQGSMSLLEKFELLAELGYDGVEPGSPNQLDTDELVSAAKATGIEIHGVVDSEHWRSPFSAADPKVRAKGAAALREAIADAKAYGASTVLVVPAVVRKNVNYQDAYERSQAEIRAILPDAEKAGIKIVFENVWNQFLLSPMEFARYIDEFDSPWVGAYFDVGNIVKFGWPEHWIRILGHRIVKLDIKGFSRRQGFKAEIGDDDCGWDSVRKALADIGYEGWATAEVGGGGRDRLADIKERMDRVLG